MQEISPGRDCALIGYEQREEFFPEGNAGILDPLFVTALVIDSREGRRVLISLDLAIIETPGSDLLRKRVALAAATLPSEVIVSCTHTHSGPFPWSEQWSADPVEPVGRALLGPASESYAGQLESLVEECVREAVEAMRPARLSARMGCLTMGYTRRVRMGEGIRMAWNLREWDGPEPYPCADPAFAVLSITREGLPPIFCWNAAAHPVVLGKHSNMVSADWPGAVRRQIQKAYPGAISLFLHGAGGDVHPWLATGSDLADLEVVAAPASSLLLGMAGVPGGRVGDGIGTAVGEVSTDGGNISLTAWRLGPVKLLAVPGELFGTTGAAIRSACDAPLLLATTSNGWSGYWPPAEEFFFGGYEVDCSTSRRRGDAEILTTVATELLDSLP